MKCFQSNQSNTVSQRLHTMSGNTATATAIAPAANQSVVVQRLCEMFGKNYDEVSAAIQTEMTAMEHELQCWKLQMSDRAATTTTTESKPKKAPAKPRAKKSEAAAAAAAAEPEPESATATESSADAAVVAAVVETKKAPRAKKVAAEKPTVVESAPAESNDVVDTAAASSASEPKAKKAPRAKKTETTVVAPVDATADSGSESDASVVPVTASSASEPKAKKTAAPRAKKADKPAVAAVAAETVAADEQKTKKAPRAKKVAEVVQPVVAAAVTSVDTQVDDDDTESVFEEVEIEVVEFTFDGVKYLRSKNDDNTVYDPETSDVIGKWNEENGCIDAE